MPTRLRVFYSLLTAALLFIPVVALYSELGKRSDIWWTPPSSALSLTESADRVQILAEGRPLATLVEQKQLSITDGATSHVLTPQEIGLRFNNWDRVRVQRLPFLLTYAAVIGAMLVVLLLTATGRLAYRGERPAVMP